MINNIINGLIPADDLHWSDEEKKLCALAGEEIDKILECCCHNCKIDIDDDFDLVMDIVRWVEKTKVNQLLLKHFLAGNIVISHKNENGELHFMRKDSFDELVKSIRPPE